MPKANLSWNNPSVPSGDAVVLRYVLERHERERGHEIFAEFAGGEAWTFAQTADAARRAAAGLARLGVRQGDRVLSWLPNGEDALRVWFGANWLGAVYVPINTAYRGGLLEHVIANSGAQVMVCHADLASRLGGVALGALETLILVGDRAAAELPDGLPVLDQQALRAPASETDLVLARPIDPWDEQSIIYTSGTTGPSKGVLSSYCHCATTALACFEDKDGPRMRYMVTLPLFHAGGTLGVMGMLLLGRSVAIAERFETDRFWSTVRQFNATCCTLLGAMATFLVKQPPSDADRDHPLDWAFIIPLAEDATAFRHRFGVDVYTLFNMTEISAPLLSAGNPEAAGSCGRVRAGVEVRLVDAHDNEVLLGEVGEMIVRASRPWSMNHGYNGMPQATADAWRNGWFHTGDAFRRSETGDFYFVDRMKDAIRRRGENISSFEVERECLAHPDVREAAAIAAPSEFGEDEVMVVVAPAPGHQIDPPALLEFLRARMAHFMIPRFIRVLSELPKTPTEKVQKALLREQGVTAETWDRERAGVRIKAEVVGGRRSASTSVAP